MYHYCLLFFSDSRKKTICFTREDKKVLFYYKSVGNKGLLVILLYSLKVSFISENYVWAPILTAMKLQITLELQQELEKKSTCPPARGYCHENLNL